MPNETDQAVPCLLIYQFPHMDGLPLGTLEPDEGILQNAGDLAAWRQRECILAMQDEEGLVHIVGNVYKHYVDDDDQRCIHVLVSYGDGENLRIKREDVATVLLKRASDHFVKEHPEPWVDFLDVILMFQDELDYRLVFLVDKLTRRFLPTADARGTFFSLGQMVLQCILRNNDKQRRALRRAFRKALPQLLPGTTVAKKKPGALRSGRVDFFLEHQGKLIPTQLMTDPVCQYSVDSLGEAIRRYKAETGYFFAPGIEEGVALDANMIFVQFG